MNQTRLLFSSACFLFAYSGVSAQTITVQDSPFIGDSCGSYAYVNNPSGLNSWNWLDDLGNTLQVGGDTLYGLCAGSYSISFTASSGPGSESFITGTGPCTYSTLNGTVSTTPSNAFSCTGTGAATVSGGIAPYTYTWGNGLTTANVTGLCPGYVSLYVTDAQGCIEYSTGYVSDACQGLSVSTVSDSLMSPGGGCNGTVSANASGGTAPYSYSWSSGQTTSTLNGLCPGTWQVWVVDANGCTTSSFATVYNPCANMEIQIAEIPISDTNACDGSVNLQVYGVAGPFGFNWSDGQTIMNADSLCAGTYTVTVTSGQGCVDTASVTIHNDPCYNFQSYAIPTGVYDSINCDGSIWIGSYFYGYNDTITNTIDGTAALNGYTTGLCAGTYTVVVSTANGCSNTHIVTIVDSSALVCTIPVTLNGIGPTGPAQCDGSISVTSNGSMPGPFYYLWSNGSEDSVLTNVCAGWYSVSVSDGNGCSGSASIYLDSAASSYPLDGFAYVTDETEDGLCDGTVTVYPSGGVPPYQVYQYNGVSATSLTGLCPGLYSAMIVDMAGDTIVLSYLVSTPGSVIVNEPYPDSTVIDSLFNDLVENCTIDYGSIDSAYIGSASWYTADSLAVTWAVYSLAGVEYITETYYIGGGNGVYSFMLAVYCPQKSTDQFLKVYDQYYVGGSLGLTGPAESDMIVFPNPFSDRFVVQFAQAGDYTVALYDVAGRYLLGREGKSSDTLQLDGLGALEKGNYLLCITGVNGSVTRALVK